MLMEVQKNKDLAAVTSQDDTRNMLTDSDVEIKIKDDKRAVQQVELKSQGNGHSHAVCIYTLHTTTKKQDNMKTNKCRLKVSNSI